MKNILLFNFPESSEFTDKVLKELGQNSNMKTVCMNTPIEATQFLLSEDNTIVVLHATSRMDLIQANIVLKKLKNRIKSNTILPIAITELAKGEYTESLKTHFCSNNLPKNVQAQELIIEILKSSSIISVVSDTNDSPIRISEKDNSKRHLEIVIDTDKQSEIEEKAQSSYKEINTNLDSGSLDIGIKCDDAFTPCKLEHFCLEQIECEVLGSDMKLNLIDLVELSIVFKYDKCKIELELEGMVSGIEETANQNRIVTIDLSTRNNMNLDNFMVLFQKRQKSIHEFMELAKGC